MRKLLFIGILLLTEHLLTAQTYIKAAEFTAPNPTSAEMMKFGLTPINQYTGKANVSIPLYNMNFDGLQIPFTLSYDTGGVRVIQESSWVGLGWNLSGTPTISHVINQRSDIGVGRLNMGDSGVTSGYCFEPALPAHESGLDLTVLGNGPGSYLGDTYDTQPDIFIANLYNSVIKFQLTQKAATSTIQARILNNSNAQISYNESNRHFIITDENGYQYHFTEIEKTSNGRFNNSLFSGEPEPEDVLFTPEHVAFSYGLDANIPTTWYVSKVVSPTGKELHYEYYGQDEDIEEYYHLSMPTYIQTKGAFVCGIDINNGTLDGSNLPNPFGYTNYMFSRVESKYLKEIIDTSTGERIVFETSFRDDLRPFDFVHHYPLSLVSSSNYNRNGEILKLDGMNIFASDGNLLKKISFENSDYFNSDKSSHSYKEKYLRLKLDGVSVDGYKYFFDYQSPNSLPKKNTKDVDFWGFYNGANNTVRYTSIEFNSTFCGIQDAEYNQIGEIIGAKKGSNFNFGKIGSLSKITYPTGGYTTFEYESNTVRLSLNSNSSLYTPETYYYLMDGNLETGYPLTSSTNSSIKTFKVGGLRVKKVVSFDKNNQKLLEKSYHYESSENSSVPVSTGKLMNRLLFFNLVDKQLEGGNIKLTEIETSSINNVSGNASAMGSHVGYDKVEEVIENTQNSSTSGKVTQTFINKPNIALQPTYHQIAGLAVGAPPIHYEDGNGKVLRTEIFNKTGTKLNETLNSYQLKNTYQSTGYRIYYETINSMFLAIPVSFNEVYDIYKYQTRRYVPLLSESSEIFYFNGNSIHKNTTNYYNSKDMLSATEVSRSNLPGTSDRVEFYYPYSSDFGVSNYVFMSDLVNENRISSPVYVRKFSDGLFIGHEFQTYKSYNGFYKPYTTHYGKTDGPLSSIEERVRINAYDNYGNLSEMSLNTGSLNKYIWGYEMNRPVAVIKNAPVDASVTPVEDILEISELQNPRATETFVGSEINKLRTHADYQDSEIQTFMHIPGVGASKITDTRNYATHFTYDDKERLTQVRDNSNMLLSENDYNYINASASCVDCHFITVNTNSYTYVKTENIQVTYNFPSGLSPVSKWKISYGEGDDVRGTGNPPSVFNKQYTTNGLKIIRLYLYLSDGSFITGHKNIRIEEGTVAGSNVEFKNIVVVNARKKSARIYGDPGSIVTYTGSIGGSRPDQVGFVSVSGGTSLSLSGYQNKTGIVTIPSSGYVNCYVQINYPSSGIISGSITLTLDTTTVGQIGSPSSLSVSYYTR